MPEPSCITGWRTAWSAFRTPGRRVEALLVTTAVVVAYLACIAAATAVALVVNALAMEPTAKALFSWTPDSTLAQIVEAETAGTVVGAPLFFVNVWLLRRGLNRAGRMIDGWIERSGL